MATRRSPPLSSRKQPRQARSSELVAAVLQAATQVLASEGAPRFTTARVAERAGVSVGSIYQYFPNKAAILFRLQSDEWRQTSELLRSIMGDAAVPPLQRLRTLVHAFLQSECAEAQMRTALKDAAPLYRDAPEAREARAQNRQAALAFMAQVLPDADAATRERAAALILATLSAVGKQFSETRRGAAEIAAYADAMADMFCAYVSHLERTSVAGPSG